MLGSEVLRSGFRVEKDRQFFAKKTVPSQIVNSVYSIRYNG